MNDNYLAQFYGKSQNYTDIPNKWYKEYNVKKGLRNEDGTGVRVGLTRVADVVGYEENPEGGGMSPDEVVVKACAIFVGEAYKAIHDALKAGFPLLDADELPAPVASFVESWTLLFVGAPMGSNN